MQLTSVITATLGLLAWRSQVAFAATAHVLTIGSQADARHNAQRNSLSPSIARLVLAQRAGIEDYHTTGGLDEEAIQAINEFGSRSSLFEDKPQRKRTFLLVETDSDAKVLSSSSLPYTQFSVEDAPTFSSSEDLFYDLFRQAHPKSAISEMDLYDASSIERIPSPSFHIAGTLKHLSALIDRLHAKDIDVTALLVPSGSRDNEWGTYNMPNMQSPLKKRQTGHRFLEDEEPMSAPSTHDTSPPFPVFKPFAANSSVSKPLHGILPACFPNLHSCESTTRNCTGHGACRRKYTNKDDPTSEKGVECWTCSCSATVRDNKTTHWGGPACQKKDISVEFWLIALFTVGLVSLVSFAIGNLLSMGNEELPSVIGAGVSGPSRK